MNNYKLINKCPITGDTDSIIYLDLGLMPLVNNLNNTREESLNCSKYPLAVQIFKKSKLSSLTVEINPDILYQNYLYKSGVSQPYIDHCNEMYEWIDHYIDFKKEKSYSKSKNIINIDNIYYNILDIGGNDGTLLKTFLKQNPLLNVLNIDASENLTKEAELNGIPSINDYWGVELAKKLNKKFKVITTTNCFQHTSPIESFVEGISLSLDKFGIWCLEFPYWKNSIETNQFDQVYHEHIYYYLLKPLVLLLDKYNLRIIKATEYSIHGGTLRLTITHKGKLGETLQPCWSVQKILDKEKLNSNINDYIEWGKNIKNNILKSTEFILSLKNKGYKIAGFGAAAKGCIYLNAANINFNQIDYIIDDTNLKQGKFVPGTGIEIVSREKLKTKPVDYIIILAHNFSEYIIKLLKQDGYKGKFIILLPTIKEI
jgi:hypothetical protein